ncbi:hypothetical protein [Saccharothrix algeriensis]|uniref:Uncharacterized protein n=1 Tax=Saccharothrix algeriensis TaxID=173560 RepID=A0A8T8HVL6_9PSEU|nr:hypothetical protein [Saccharothrix algeriensis]MBM7814261.1 hypothetical protein [Saccharothrix algeriensis]QTR02613.1 hypothetical protein J7S33_26565 [Saccharothrix algeriensis]
MDDQSELHERAALLGIVDHDLMTPEQLRVAIRERERGADPRQAEEQAGKHVDGDAG